MNHNNSQPTPHTHTPPPNLVPRGDDAPASPTASPSATPTVQTPTNFQTPIPLIQTPAASLPQTTPPAPASPASSPEPPPTPLEAARKSLPLSVLQRKFRAGSFAASLTPDQRSTLCAWLNKYPAEEVQKRVALPAPKGFGKTVHLTTLARLKKSFENLNLSLWLADAADTACDVLHAETAFDPAPIREALSLILYSRAIHFAEQQAPVEEIDKLVAAISRLEKLKSPAPRASTPSRPGAPLTTRHHVELTIRTPQNPGDPKSVDAILNV